VPFVGDETLVRHLWRLLNEDRIDARLVFCAPIPATGRERRALAAQTRVQILETLGLMLGAAKSTAPTTAPGQAGRRSVTRPSQPLHLPFTPD
jgi:1-acyl-sn-glycerol-3-phosphate acyltransferase